MTLSSRCMTFLVDVGDRRASASAFNDSRACASSGRSCSSLIRKKSSARSPNVAMRASCTRTRHSRNVCATAASRPGRSAQISDNCVNAAAVAIIRDARRDVEVAQRARDRRAAPDRRDTDSSTAHRRARGAGARCGAASVIARPSASSTRKLSMLMPSRDVTMRASCTERRRRSNTAVTAANRPSRRFGVDEHFAAAAQARCRRRGRAAWPGS